MPEVRRDPLRLLMLSDAARAVSVLAELAPMGAQTNRTQCNVTDRVLLPLDSLGFLRMPMAADRPAPLTTGARGKEIVDMVKRSHLHGEEGDLRLGWLWVTIPNARRAPDRFPLVSARVSATSTGASAIFLSTAFATISMARAGDIEMTDLIGDDDEREHLEATIEFGDGSMSGHSGESIPPGMLSHLPQLLDWVDRAAAAAGFEGARIVTVEPHRLDAPVVVAQAALYLDERAERPGTASTARSLHEWARVGIDRTAFATLYDSNVTDDDPSDDGPVMSSVVLADAQRAVIRSARSAQTTVVSGPPGSGKTQTVVAAALDVVERGGSVLVAAPSHAAVEALTTLLTETPGPDPVVFGDASRRTEVADRLGQGGGDLLDRDAVQRSRTASRAADAAFHEHYRAVADVLEAERIAAGVDPAQTFRARTVAPAWFDANADHATAGRLLDAATRSTGWLAGLRRARALRKVVAHASAPTEDVGALAQALTLARAERTATQLVATGGIDLERSWERLVQLDDARRDALGRMRHAEAHAASRVDRHARATMGAVAAALRSGRARRRRRLATIDGGDMVEALPLWVGTLRDVEDLLPRTPAIFDLVIVDEASQVDQIQAAPALLRARRSMIVGDPKQLRHVSFLGDDEIAAAIDKKGADSAGLAHRLDVRRMSLFDLGAATARTRLLDEHFRSTPHLIEFSSRRFYDGRLRVAKRHPSNHAHDHICVRTVVGRRSDEGVNDVEVEAVIQIVARLSEGLADGRRVGTVGVVAPTRAQADRLEEAALEKFDLGVIDALRLRVGTVHAFQGCERDLVVISLTLDDESPTGSRTFVANANLFNVMVTRARERIELVTSITHDNGLIGEYLRYAESAPGEPGGADHSNPIVAQVAEDLRLAGVSAVTSYPAGRHAVDLVVGADERAVAVTFGVHAEGVDAHIERELSLRRFGWRTVGVFASRWEDREAELAVDLARIVQSTTPHGAADQQ